MPQQCFPVIFGYSGPGLVQKRNHIVGQWAFSTALKINKVRFIVVDNYIPGLKIAVHKKQPVVVEYKVSECVKIMLQLKFVVRYIVQIQEVVFKIIQIPFDTLSTKLFYRIIFR